MPTRSPSLLKKAMPEGVLAHHKLIFCGLVGLIVAVALPDVHTIVSRVLIGWNVLAWLYLVGTAIVLVRADAGHMKRVALAQAESAATVLAVVAVAAITSLAAVVVELIAAKAAGAHHAAGHLALAAFTVVGSWLLMPTLFALTYAASYYGAEPDRGLQFPGTDAKFEPHHLDFFYFSFTIAVTAQTSDVGVTTREMRRLVVYHSLLSFVFNTTILAFSINAAASFF